MVSDVDGLQENRRGTISLFDGPAPVIRLFKNEAAEAEAVGAWVADRLREGYALEEVAILVRSTAQVSRARAAAKVAGAKAAELDEKVDVTAGSISISPMHLAKGLEFRAVAVMACDDEVLPLQERVEAVTDEADLLEVYETERHLLYVACTRARDSLWVSGVEPESEFLRDMRASG
jgi:superfamily I DNA/RNA helicase